MSFLIHWRRMMGTHFTVLRRTRIFFTWSRMVIGCEVEDGDLLPRQRTDSRDLQGLPLTCRGCPQPSGILVSPNNLGWGSRYFRQPNDVVTREINKVNFQIIKYQKLTSLHLDDVSGGVYWTCPLPTLEIELMDRFTRPRTSFLSRVQVGLKLGVVDVLVCWT